MKLLPSSATVFPILIGGTALFLGTANPLVHIPLLIILYPATLYALGLRSSHPFRHGWWAGLLGASASLYWIAVAVHDYGYVPWAAAGPCAVALGMYVGLWGGFFARLVTAMQPLPPLRRCLGAACAWYLLEWTRSWFGTGFPWLTLSGGLAAWPELIQGASLVGGYGLSGVLAGLGCLVAEAVLPEYPSPATARHKTRLPVTVAALILISSLAGFGFWRVQAFDLDAMANPLTMVLVQGNVKQDVKWDPAFQQATVDKYINLSREALAALPGRPAAIIWPETAMPFHYQADKNLAPRLRDFARETGVPLLFGGPGFARISPDETALYNRTFLIDDQGENQGHYDKQHLVPFGEYVPPLLDFTLFESLTQGIGGFTPGSDTPPFRLKTQGDAAALGMLICYEAIFPEIARQRVAQGATVLVNTSNDAWYNRTSAPVQHLHLSLLRAVEQGRWMARASNTGITAFISPLGTTTSVGDITDGSGLFIDATLAGQVRPVTAYTLYFTLHPWLPTLAFLALAAIVWPLSRKKIFRKKGEPQPHRIA